MAQIWLRFSIYAPQVTTLGHFPLLLFTLQHYLYLVTSQWSSGATCKRRATSRLKKAGSAQVNSSDDGRRRRKRARADWHVNENQSKRITKGRADGEHCIGRPRPSSCCSHLYLALNDDRAVLIRISFERFREPRFVWERAT